ncbi:MAG: START-like domain-containing protein [Cyclobacteriaceae bacterium]
MSDTVFELEYEIKASIKMIFPYISSASGLANWFCDDVVIKPNGKHDFIWDNESHIGDINIKKMNKSVSIVYDEGDNNYVNLELTENEFTQSIFIKVEDASDMADTHEDCDDIWVALIDDLKENFGG